MELKISRTVDDSLLDAMACGHCWHDEDVSFINLIIIKYSKWGFCGEQCRRRACWSRERLKLIYHVCCKQGRRTLGTLSYALKCLSSNSGTSVASEKKNKRHQKQWRRGQKFPPPKVISFNLLKLHKHNKWNKIAMTSAWGENMEKGEIKVNVKCELTICERIMYGHPSKSISGSRHNAEEQCKSMDIRKWWKTFSRMVQKLFLKVFPVCVLH